MKKSGQPEKLVLHPTPIKDEKGPGKAKYLEIIKAPPRHETVSSKQWYVNSEGKISHGSEDTLGLHQSHTDQRKAEPNNTVDPPYVFDEDGVFGPSVTTPEPRKAYSNLLLDNRAKQILTVSHIDSKENIPIDNGFEYILKDICSECHQEYETTASSKSTLCPSCVGKSFPEEIKPDGKFETVYQGKYIIVGRLILYRKEFEDGRYNYEKTDEGWQWVWKQDTTRKPIKAAA